MCQETNKPNFGRLELDVFVPASLIRYFCGYIRLCCSTCCSATKWPSHLHRQPKSHNVLVCTTQFSYKSYLNVFFLVSVNLKVCLCVLSRWWVWCRASVLWSLQGSFQPLCPRLWPRWSAHPKSSRSEITHILFCLILKTLVDWYYMP